MSDANAIQFFHKIMSYNTRQFLPYVATTVKIKPWFDLISAKDLIEKYPYLFEIPTTPLEEEK